MPKGPNFKNNSFLHCLASVQIFQYIHAIQGILDPSVGRGLSQSTEVVFMLLIRVPKARIYVYAAT